MISSSSTITQVLEFDEQTGDIPPLWQSDLHDGESSEEENSEAKKEEESDFSLVSEEAKAALADLRAKSVLNSAGGKVQVEFPSDSLDLEARRRSYQTAQRRKSVLPKRRESTSPRKRANATVNLPFFPASRLGKSGQVVKNPLKKAVTGPLPKVSVSREALKDKVANDLYDLIMTNDRDGLNSDARITHLKDLYTLLTK